MCLNYPENIPTTLLHEKIVFPETSSWCPKGWGPLHLMCLHLQVPLSFIDAVSNTNMIKHYSIGILTSLVAQMVKKPPAMLGSTPGLGRSLGGGHGNPLHGLNPLHGESHGQRSLVGYSPWGRKESNTTE